MTNSTEDEAVWAIEVECNDAPTEYYSVLAFKGTDEEIHIITTDRSHVAFKVSDIRKLLIMRAKKAEAVST